MIHRQFLPLVALLSLTALAPSAHAACTLAIAHVTVVPMDTERVLPDRTVTVTDGRIAAILPGGTPVRCAQTIDGSGRYLVPGLNDMHVHVETLAFAKAFGTTAPPIDYAGEMALYMANGVTGIRVMSGAPDILAFRDAQHGRASPFPRMLVATPMLSGAPPVLPEPVTRIVTTPEAGRAAVREYKRAGYDFVKVRDNVPAAVLRAVIDEAGKEGLYVDGHISERQGLSVFDVLRSGQKGIAHLDNLALLMTDKQHDPETYVRLLKACDCFVSTTMQVEVNAAAQITDYDTLVARPALKYMNPLMLDAFWRKPNNPYLKQPPDPKFFRTLYADEKVLLKTLFDSGVHIVAGTDALNPMIVPGESLHDELDSLVEAGLTPYQALKTATANPAAYVPGFADIGILAPGRTANALLVDRNPLADLQALRDPAAVMINGHWMTREDLHARLAQTALANLDLRLRAEYPPGGPGAYAIAAKDGHSVFSRGYGLANVELGVPLAQGSVVRLASLTKQFTAVAVLRLVQDGTLGFDDTLAKRLPDCPAAWAPITLRQLLGQTSGLAGDLAPVLAHLKEDLTPDQILALYRDRPLEAAPGARWQYSNLNYWILGRVIEAASGKPYAEFVTARVLVPGMAHTRYGSHADVIPGRAQGYEPAGAGWHNAPYFSASLGYAAGGFLSTPSDMATWYGALGRGEIVSKQMLALALTEGRTSDGEPTGYGFGWYVAGGIACHGGSTFGFQASICWDPATNSFAGVFKNTNDPRGEPDADTRAVLDAVR